MRSCYADLATRAVADLVELDPSEYEPNTWLLTRVQVPREQRGKGVARSLLARVLADADAEGVTLEVHVMPYGSDGLQYRDLAQWYARHGFGVLSAARGRMVRRPLREAVRYDQARGQRAEVDVAQDTELTTELARAVTQAPGQYRFTVPATRRDNAREWLKRYTQAAGTRATTRTDGDTMWVTVER